MKTVLIFVTLLIIGFMYVSHAAELATPSRILTSEEAQWRDTVAMGSLNAKMAKERREREPMAETPTEYTDDGWPIPTILPYNQLWLPELYRRPIVFPSQAQLVAWNWQRQQAVQMAAAFPQEQPWQTVERVAAVYLPQTEPQNPVVVVQEMPHASMTVTSEQTTVNGLDVLSDDVRSSILEISRQAQEHDLKRLDLRLKEQAQRFEREKAFLLEEQRRTTLGLLGGGFGLAVFFLLMQYSGRKYLELLKDVKML